MNDRGGRWVRGFETAQAASYHAEVTYEPWKMGAAMFSGNNLLSVGFNLMRKSHPQSQHIKGYNTCVHAEQMALIRRRHYDGNSNLIMYVWRTGGDGKAASSKPCPNCRNLMRLAGVRKVRYYSEDGEPEEMKL